jgi:hypothetical protein
MRTKIVAVLAGFVALVGLSGIASAASISLEWDGGGGNTISAAATGAHTVDIIVTADASGIALVSLSLQASGGVSFTGMVTDGGANQECISPPNLAPGLCFAGGGSLSPFTNGVGSISASQVTTIESGTVGTGPTSASFTLAQAIVNVTGGGGISVFFVTGIDGVSSNAAADITGATSIANAVVTPEPGTAALLGLGLGALAIAGRRR